MKSCFYLQEMKFIIANCFYSSDDLCHINFIIKSIVGRFAIKYIIGNFIIKSIDG